MPNTPSRNTSSASAASRIYLIGFMGSGKTTVGRLLAQRLGMLFWDTDKVIEETLGLSIPEIFAQKGEDFFREVEHKILKNSPTSAVVATGGGIVLKEENREILRKTGTAIFLNITFEEFSKRAPLLEKRPLLKEGLEKARRLFFERLPLYRETAHCIVNVDGKTPEEIVEEIICYLNSK